MFRTEVGEQLGFVVEVPLADRTGGAFIGHGETVLAPYLDRHDLRGQTSPLRDRLSAAQDRAARKTLPTLDLVSGLHVVLQSVKHAQRGPLVLAPHGTPIEHASEPAARSV